MKQSLNVGTDIIEISRIRLAIERHGQRFLSRLFTSKERSYCNRYRDPIPHFAARFAAKEAIIKALSKNFPDSFTWQDIEILNSQCGQPEAFFSQTLQKHFPYCNIILSMSHCNEYALATAISLQA